MIICGLGTDIIEISRIKKAAQRATFLERIFTSKELAICGEKQNFYASLAVRFAAKEAVAKALGTGFRGIKWRDIEIMADTQGKPLVILHNRAAVLATELGIQRWHLSLSHCRDYALAFSIGEGSE